MAQALWLNVPQPVCARTVFSNHTGSSNTPAERGRCGQTVGEGGGVFARMKNGRGTGGRWGGIRALLYKAFFGGDRCCVVASAVPVLCFVPVIRVFTFTWVSLPLSLPLPLPLSPPLLVLLIFAIVAISPLSSLVLLPCSWKMGKGHNYLSSSSSSPSSSSSLHLCSTAHTTHTNK